MFIINPFYKSSSCFHKLRVIYRYKLDCSTANAQHIGSVDWCKLWVLLLAVKQQLHQLVRGVYVTVLMMALLELRVCNHALQVMAFEWTRLDLLRNLFGHGSNRVSKLNDLLVKTSVDFDWLIAAQIAVLRFRIIWTNCGVRVKQYWQQAIAIVESLFWILSAQAVEANNLTAELTSELKAKWHFAALWQWSTASSWHSTEDLFGWVWDDLPYNLTSIKRWPCFDNKLLHENWLNRFDDVRLTQFVHKSLGQSYPQVKKAEDVLPQHPVRWLFLVSNLDFPELVFIDVYVCMLEHFECWVTLRFFLIGLASQNSKCSLMLVLA